MKNINHFQDICWENSWGVVGIGIISDQVKGLIWRSILYRFSKWQGFICVSIEKLPSSEHLIQRKDINTTSEAKHTIVSGNEEVLKTDKKKNVIDNAKEDDSENSQKKYCKTIQMHTKKLMNKCLIVAYSDLNSLFSFLI